jgi:replicative DNA helicase
MNEQNSNVNIDAEMGVLGSMMLSRSAARHIIARAHERIFWRPAHQIIYRAIADIVERGGEADIVSMRAELGASVEAAGGMDYVLKLAEFVPSPANWATYLGIIERLWRRRRIVEIGNRMATDDEYEVDDATLFQLVGAMEATQPVRIGEVEGAEQPRVIVPTGFSLIDNESGGIGLGGTAVILANSGGGKSAFCIHRAIHAARQGFPVLYLSLMDLDEKAMRRRAMQAMTGWTRKPDHGKPLDDWNLAEKELNEIEIYLHAPYRYRGGNRLGNLIALIERARHRMGVKVVVLDYVQRIQYDERANEYQASLNAENELTLLANRLGIVLWYASQATEGERGLVTKGGKHWNEGSECTVVLEMMNQAQMRVAAKEDPSFVHRFSGRTPIKVTCEKMRHARRFMPTSCYLNDRLELVEP